MRWSTLVWVWLLLAACRPQGTQDRASTASDLTTDTLQPISIDEASIPDALRYVVAPREWYGYWMIRTDTVQTDTARQLSIVRQYYTKTVHRIAPDGRIELSVRIDTLIAAFTLPGDTAGAVRHFLYDSRKSEDRQKPDFAHLTALLGAEVRMLVTPDGRIDSVFGLRSVLDRLRQLSQDTVPAELGPMLERQLAEQLYRPLQQEYLAFPTAPLDSTRRWRHEYADVLASLFPTQNVAEYRIVGARRQEERILLEIDAQLRARLRQRQLQEGSLRAELRNEALSGSGRIVIDARQGYTVAKEVYVSSRFELFIRDTLQQRTEHFRQRASSHVRFQLTQRGWLTN